jgi:hypothetical protein
MSVPAHSKTSFRRSQTVAVQSISRSSGGAITASSSPSHHLLRRLDQAFEGYHPPLRVKTKAGLLLLGEGWWLAYRSAKTAETGNEISRTDWIRDTPLPRIRVVPGLGALWLNSDPLRERIWKGVALILRPQCTVRLGNRTTFSGITTVRL